MSNVASIPMVKQSENTTNSANSHHNFWVEAIGQNVPNSNWRTNEYFEIVSLLNQMSQLDSDSDFHVGEEVKERAVQVLSFIKNTYSIPLPKILPEGEDCLSLTWNSADLKQFLTIYDDEVEGTRFNPKLKIRCSESLFEGKEVRTDKLFVYFSYQPKSKSVE